MTKYLTILFLTLFYVQPYIGQISIESEDMPDAGMSYIYSNASNFGEFNLDGGADLNWDYSFLESINNDSLTYVTVDGAPFAYQFLFNNPFIPEYLADHALNTPDVDLGGFVTFEDNYTFFQNNSGEYLQLGTGIQVNGVPGVGTNNPIDTVYQFPLNFEDADTSYTELDIIIPGLYSYHQELTRRNFVDGYGTLELPIGEFEVLRVRTELESVDSIYIELLELGFSFPQPLTVEYKWLAQGEGVPVLQINETSGFISEVIYKDSLIMMPDNILEESLTEINVFPNPADETLNLDNLNQYINGILYVYTSEGRLVNSKVISGDNMQLDVSKLEGGNYFLFIIHERNIYQGSFIKEN